MASQDLLTRAEHSGYEATSLYEDVRTFAHNLADRFPLNARVDSFGVTPEGRDLLLVTLSEDPAGVMSPRKPVVLLMAGIHAGEVEGKEACLMYARDVLHGQHGDILRSVNIVIVPLLNPDGNDRISDANRRLEIDKLVGQIGPTDGVGTRNNAAGINLNRDYVRQDGVEMRLFQRHVLIRANPHMVIDCHTTNGSIHRFAMTYDVPHNDASGRREPIDFMRQRLLPAVSAAVRKTDGYDSFYYGNFLRDERGEGQGWITYPHHPRFGANYRGLTNRLDLLLEAYSYIPFRDRVQVTYAFIRESISYLASHSVEVIQLLEDCETPPDKVAVAYSAEPAAVQDVDILTRHPYALDGSETICTVPHLAEFRPTKIVRRPAAYAVPPSIALRLQDHGLKLCRPGAGQRFVFEVPIVEGRVEEAGRSILESSTTSSLQARYETRTGELPHDWRVATTEQQRGALLVYLCEAESDDGGVVAGWFGDLSPGDELACWRILREAPNP